MNYLFVLHDSPYGTERTYNGIRWAQQILDADSANRVRVFNFSDAVISVTAALKVPDESRNLAQMTAALVAKGAVIGNCGACMAARGLTDDRLIDGAHGSSMTDLAEWTTWADQIINV